MDESFSLHEDSPSDLDTTLDRNISDVIDVLNKENFNESNQSDSTTAVNNVLQGVCAYVEVRTNSDNRSQAVNRMLHSLGAEVEKTFTNEVTHVIFKDGNKRTIDKAKKKGIHLVSVLWVDSCLRNDRKVSEDIYPAILPQRQKAKPILFKKNRLKKMKSMQPNDFEEDVAKSSERCERKRRKDAEKLGLSGSSTPVLSPVILAPDTCQRSPPSPCDWRSPIPLVIPDTPPSMKAQIQKIREARRNSSCGTTESPLAGSVPVQPLHRKLFNGVEGKSSPGISNLDALFTAEIKTTGCHSDPGVKAPENSEESAPAAPKRKLFNLNNSPQSFLVEPTHSSDKRLPTLMDSNPWSNKTKKVMSVSSKVKGEKRKKSKEGGSTGETKEKKRTKTSPETEETSKVFSSTTAKDLSKKSDEQVTAVSQKGEGQSQLVKPIKNIHAQYLLNRLEGMEKPDLDLSETDDSVKCSTQRRSSRRSSVLLRSSQSNSSLDSTGNTASRRASIAVTPDLGHSLSDRISKTRSKQLCHSTPELVTDETSDQSKPKSSESKNSRKSSESKNSRKSSKRVSLATPEFVADVTSKQSKPKSSDSKNSRKSSENISFATPEFVADSRSEQSKTKSNEIKNSRKLKQNASLTRTPEFSPIENSCDISTEIPSVKPIRSSRRASMAVTPHLSPATDSLRRSSRRMSAACFRGCDGTLSRNSSTDSLVFDQHSSDRKDDNNDTMDKLVQDRHKGDRRVKVDNLVYSNDRKVKDNETMDERTTGDFTNNQSLNTIKTKDRGTVDKNSNKKYSVSEKLNDRNSSIKKSSKGPSDRGNAISGKTTSKLVKGRQSSVKADSILNGINETNGNQTERTSRHSDVNSTTCNQTLDHPDSSRNETTGLLGASMSTFFGDTSLPSFSQNNSRRSIDEFKTFSRKKTAARTTLSSICEIERGVSEKSKIPPKNQKKNVKKSQKKCKDFENVSIELPEEEVGCLQSDLLTLQRARAICKQTTFGDAGGKITRPTIVMTSLHKSEQEVVSAVIKKLGGFLLVDNVNDATTHVVCGDARRTLNVLNGIIRGCWLVHKEWVLKSLDTGEWLDEEDYEVCDIFPTCKVTRKQRQECGRSYRQVLFSDVGSVFISSRCSPPRSAVVTLLRLCGGEITGSVSRCDLFIGDEASRNKTSIKPIWILDCIMEHKLLDYNQPKYLLKEVCNRASSPEF